MNTTQDDGGPAFPCSDINDDLTYPRGMSLRDYFAGMAMQGMASNHEMWESKELAECSYMIADAMLSARKEAK